MSQTRYMFDTNIVSYIVNGDDLTKEKLKAFDLNSVFISAITEAELRFGIAKKGQPKALKHRVDTLLNVLEILPWGFEVAAAFASLRTSNQKNGINLSAMDMLIAAHAASEKLTLVTNDKAFSKLAELDVLNW